MLKLLRKKKHVRKTLWILLAAFILPAFVLWGTGSAIRNRGRSTYAGSIFGRRVPRQEYLRQLSACKNLAIMRYGDKFNQVKEYLNLEQEAWDRLILLHQAKRERLTVADQEVIDRIKNLAIFQKKGGFDEGYYRTLLEYAFRIEPREFEEQIREAILITKLYEKITQGVSVSEEELRQEYKKENEKAKVSLVFFAPEDFKEKVSLDEDEIKHYFESHSQEFKRPPEVNVEYIGIDFSDISSQLEVPEEELNEYYQSHKEEFKSGLPQEGEKDYRPFEEVKEDIRQRVLSVKAYAQAKERMKEIISKEGALGFQKISQGYSLPIKETGFFSPRDPIPDIGWSYQFTQAAFDLREGQTQGPIATPKGIYIIRLKERKKSTIPSFEEAKEEVKEALRLQKAKELARQQATSFREKLSEILADRPNLGFREAAQELSLEVSQTPLFTRREYIPDIGLFEEFWQAAFSLSPGQISEVISTPRGYYILSLDEFIPVDEEKFLKEKTEFRDRLIERKKEERFSRFYANLRKQANPQIYPIR
jgi:peptidyl-prolyl cis-trans isomerase D